MAGGPLVGREIEMAALNGFFRRVPDGPACLVLIGEPGIGKTALWESGVDDARRGDALVLVHRAVEAEAALSFTGLADLITPVFEQASGALPERQKRALAVAIRLSEPAGELPTDQLAIGLALLNLVEALAARKPVVLAIDDLQWLDPSTAAVLGVALRRLDTEAFGLLATVRQASGVRIPLDLDRAFVEERLRKLDVGPLGLGDLHHLLRERLGLELTRPEQTRVWETADGNPYFALELGRELARTNTRPEIGRSLRPSPTLRDLLVTRLMSLSPATRDVLLSAAALAQPSVEVIARAYGDEDPVLESLGEARREGLIGLVERRVRFTHPLLASVCYEEASPARRRSVHRLLAAAVNDAEEQARHLALSSDSPDEAIATVLEDAAQHAGARGATASGAELAELAARLTPAENPTDRRRRRLQAAALHRLSGDLARANGALEELLHDVPPGVERADVLYALVVTGQTNMVTMARFCQEALAEAATDDARCAEIFGFLGLARWRLGEVPAAVQSTRAGLERAERTKDKRLLALTLARLCVAEDAALDLTPGLLERAIEIESATATRLLNHESPKFVYAFLMLHRDRIDRCREILEEVDAEAGAAGDEVTRQNVALNMIPLEWYAGRWEQARQQADIALEFDQQTREHLHGTMLQRYRALIEADRGLLAEARQSAEEGIQSGRLISDELGILGSVAVLGRIELLSGDLSAAVTRLRDLPDRLLSAGWLGPDSVDLWPDSIETLIRSGELERAQSYLDIFEELAPRASRRWVAAAARCRGLLAAAMRDFEAAFDQLDRAYHELELVGHYPLDRGRTLLTLGSIRRQTGRKAPARAALEEALAIFSDLDARPWSSWAVAELRRISGRRAPSHALTETELRVATLASQGLSNPEIASALFMGVSTVEAHLSRVYGKLGVRRTELATHLRDLQASQS